MTEKRSPDHSEAFKKALEAVELMGKADDNNVLPFFIGMLKPDKKSEIWRQGRQVAQKKLAEPRDIALGGVKTTVPLDDDHWRALHEVAAREHLSVDELCQIIYGKLPHGRTLADGIHVFLAAYSQTLGESGSDQDFRSPFSDGGEH